MPNTISKKKSSITSGSSERFQKTATKALAKKATSKSKALTQADKITLSLHEVQQIESGKKKAKSFDDFLGEL